MVQVFKTTYIMKFNLEILNLIEIEKIEVPDVIIKEWIWSKSNPYQTPELVKAEQIGWGVPTIQRLWFG